MPVYVASQRDIAQKLRRIFEENSKGVPGASYQESMSGWRKLAMVLVPPAVVLALIGAIEQLGVLDYTNSHYESFYPGRYRTPETSVTQANRRGSMSNSTEAAREIELDATNWMTVYDFYNALLSVLAAPDNHGRNINALIDSMIWGGINEVEPPYSIRIRGVATLPKDVRDHIELAKNYLSKARADFRTLRGRDVEVQFETAA